MTRINRPDTLLTELRDIRRRLRLLEAARRQPPAGARPLTAARPGPGPARALPTGADTADPGPAVPLMPARPVDWPGTASPEWERLAVTQLDAGRFDGGRGVRVLLYLAAEPGTTGAARIVVDGRPAGEPVPVPPAVERRTIAVTGEDLAGEAGGSIEIVVEAHRTGGTGLVRVAALLLP